MKRGMFAIRDRKADCFASPFTSVNEATALRMFKQACNDRNNVEMVSNLEDYDLYQLGWFDDNIGAVENLERPKMIAIGSDMKVVV